MEKKIQEIENGLKKYSKEELIEKAYHLGVPVTDGSKVYPKNWIRYDIAIKLGGQTV